MIIASPLVEMGNPGYLDIMKRVHAALDYLPLNEFEESLTTEQDSTLPHEILLALLVQS